MYFLRNETSAVLTGSDLLVNSKMWGAIIFENPEIVYQDNNVLPDIVSYKLRLNSSHTHNTQYVKLFK